MIMEEKLIELIPLFEAFNTQTLIIVDVQEPFAKWWDKNGKEDLPERINDFCANFPDVYQIWDDHNAEKPTWKFYNQVAAIRKHYGVDDPNGEIKDYSAIFRPEDIEDAMEMGKSGEIATPKLYKTIDGNYIIRVIGGNHKWFNVSKEMYDILSGITNNIVLVGGAEGECLKDIQTLLDILGKNHSCEQRFCYNATDKDVGFGDDDDTQHDEEESEEKAQPIPLEYSIN